MVGTLLVAIAGFLALGVGAVLFGALWAIPIRNAQLAAKNAWPEAADSFYEEFERQLAILEMRPDPLKAQRLRRELLKLGIEGSEKDILRLTRDNSTLVMDDTTYKVAVSFSDSPTSIAAKLKRAVKDREVGEAQRAYSQAILSVAEVERNLNEHQIAIYTREGNMVGFVPTGVQVPKGSDVRKGKRRKRNHGCSSPPGARHAIVTPTASPLSGATDASSSCGSSTSVDCSSG